MQINPIISKDLKIKMRGWKAPVLLTVYMVFLGLVVFLNFFGSRIFSPYDYYQFNPAVALNSYNSLATLQLLLLMFITPALTGGIISGERERQTLDLLLCTNLPTSSIITGKIVVATAHVLLLITASLPVMGTVFLYGGIRITDLLLLFAFYLATALMLGSMGAFYSSIFKKSSVSMILSYITLMVFLVGTSIAYTMWSSFSSRYTGKPPDIAQAMYFMFANPSYGFSSLVEGGNQGIGIPFVGNIFSFGMYGPYGGMPYGSGSGMVTTAIKPWMVNMAFDIIISAIFITLASIRIKPIKRLWRRRRSGIKISSLHAVNHLEKTVGSSR